MEVGVKEKEEEVKLRQGNISLVLDSYEDIFSDFDPRHYPERALSDDFLVECRRASVDKDEDEIELRLLVPKQKRSLRDESLIKKRLREHFKKHYFEKHKEIKKYKREGFGWIILGVLIFVGIFYGSLKFENSTLVKFISILEIPSWFLIWEGLGKVLIYSKEKLPDFEFYKKMHSASIDFFNY